MLKKLSSLLCIAILSISCSSEVEEEKIPDTVAPTIEVSIPGITNLSGGPIKVGNTITISIEAKDKSGIKKVEAFIDEEKVGEDLVSPYEMVLDMSSFSAKNQNSSAKNKDYKLSIVVTDIAGNETREDFTITVDSDLPIVSEVTINEGEIINGPVNPIMFNATDNDELASINVLVNGEPVSYIQENQYSFNLDTSNLQDGENELRIQVSDLAGNTTSFTITFLVDNTGPQIELESLTPDMIIDEKLTLNPMVTDDFSEVDSLQLYFRDNLIHEFDVTTGVSFDFNPDLFELGEGEIKFIATDSLGNKTIAIWSISLRRLLFTLTVPEDYLSYNISASHFVLASNLDGSIIDFKRLTHDSRQIKLYATENFAVDQEYILTFASLGQGGVASYLYSVSNVSIENFKTLELQTPNRYTGDGGKYYPINNFPEAINIYTSGRDYHFTSNEAGDKLITNYTASNHAFNQGPIYLYGYNPFTNFYNYQLVERPLPSEYEIDYNDFIQSGLQEKQINTTPSDYIMNSRSLTIYGFYNEDDDKNDLFNQIWSYGFGSNVANGYIYKLNSMFSSYAYDLVIGDYQSKGSGIPQDNVIIPNWGVNYEFQDNSISLLIEGSGHTVGEVYINGGYDIGVPHEWNLFFDSSKTSSITLPKIPEDLNSFPIYDIYLNNQIELYRVALRKYETFDNYNGFLNNVIKSNKAFIKASPRFESIYNGLSTQHFANKDYFYNWW